MWDRENGPRGESIAGICIELLHTVRFVYILSLWLT